MEDSLRNIIKEEFGKVMSKKFIYYIFRPTKVTVDKDVTPQGPANIERDIYEVPMCEVCGNFFKEQKVAARIKNKTGEEWS